MGLAPLATGAQTEEFQGVKEGLEALQVSCRQLQTMHGAVGQTQGVPAIHAGEVVLIPRGGGKECLAAGEMAAAHLT